MTNNSLQVGTQSAADLRISSAEDAIQSQPPATLKDILDRLAAQPTKRMPMLRHTAAQVAAFLNRQPQEILIDSLQAERDSFLRFLRSRKYAKNSVKTYGNHVRILLGKARDHGWKPSKAVTESWHNVFEIARQRKCSKLVLHLSRLHPTPHEVTLEDIEQWALMKVQQGQSYFQLKRKAARFWRVLLECKCTTVDLTTVLRRSCYGIPLKDFPVDLKVEVEALSKWKQAKFNIDRPKRAKHRPVTAKRLLRTISTLLGFAVNVKRLQNINSLSDLVTKETVGDFVEWCQEARRAKGASIKVGLVYLNSAMRQHPAYAGVDLKWFSKLLDAIELEKDSARRQRKAVRFLEYGELEAIPSKLRADRAMAAKKGSRKLARLVMCELLIRWLITLAWRQRNLRECRVSGLYPNLFKGRIPSSSDIDRPGWVRAEQEKNPSAEFWMFRFNSDETKTGNEVEALLPRQLIEPLEEYLQSYRPSLVRGADPGTLLLNSAGRPMSLWQVTQLVTQLTLRYGGKRVTPHMFRTIVAFQWLKDHPRDYLHLAKILWHADLSTTLRVYGRKFDESSGVCAMESWLDERAGAPKADRAP
jgi:integrase